MQSYSASSNFLKDVLRGHIIACALQYYEIGSTDEQPAGAHQTELDQLKVRTQQEQLSYVRAVSEKIVDQFVLVEEANLDSPTCPITSSRLACPYPGCEKSYKVQHWLATHMKTVHHIDCEVVIPRASRQEFDSNGDSMFNYHTSLMKMGLLFVDTVDAYKMGDGERVFRNAKFLLPHFFMTTHTKYRFWIWMMLANDLAILSEYDRYSYKNNIAINVTGGVGKCLANDHLVETQVRKVKESMKSTGANISYDASRRVAKCMGIVGELKNKFVDQPSGRHSSPRITEDVLRVAQCLLENSNLKRESGRQHATYPNIPSDLLKNFNMTEFHDWVQIQKRKAKLH